MDAQPWPTPPEPYRVRISDPGEVAAGLPHLLGFRPEESVVLIGLSGPGEVRVGLCVRADIPPSWLAARVASGLADAVATSAPSAVLLAVVSEAPDAPLLDDPGMLAGLGLSDVVDLPHRDLVHELVLALDDLRIPVRDALLVRGGRWWSYDCPHPCCAPRAGTPLPAGVTALEAASVAAGQVLAQDRAELRARIAAPEGPAASAMADTCLRVGQVWTRSPGAGPGGSAEERWAAVLAGLASARPGPSGRRLSDEEVARIAWALRDRAVRDRAIGLALGPDAEAVELLWTECTRRSPPPLDAAPATLLAISAWLRGDGAMANVALARARDSDPDHGLAVLLDDALAACLPPERLRAMLLESTLDGRGSAGERS